MNLAIRFKGERHVLQLPGAATVRELQQQVQQATQLLPAQQLLRWGFPPQRIPTEQQQLPLQEIGCTNGQLILVEAAKDTTQTACSSNSSSSSSSYSTAAASEPPAAPVRAAAAAAAAAAAVPISTFTQQQLQPDQQQQAGEGASNASEEDVLSDLAAAVAAAAAAPRPPVSSPASGYKFVRVPVPADDSCLFASVSLVAVPSVSPQQLRDVAAAGILRDPERFNEVVLEVPPEAYVKRLRNASSWGGYLELAVLSEELQHQLAVVDAETGRVDLYGQQFPHRRSYLLYDGIHYDPLVGLPPGAPSEGYQGGAAASKGPLPHPSEMLTVFAPEDAAAAAAAAAVGRAVQQQQGFVRAAGMTARCLVCGELLRDNNHLREHAVATGHQNFAHIQQ